MFQFAFLAFGYCSKESSDWLIMTSNTKMCRTIANNDKRAGRGPTFVEGLILCDLPLRTYFTNVLVYPGVHWCTLLHTGVHCYTLVYTAVHWCTLF